MSKRKWNHPKVSEEERGTVAWRSAGEREQEVSFQEHLEREFGDRAAELSEDEREMSRRDFTKLMGASSALMGLTLASCRRPESTIVPYVKSPEWMIPGKPLFYATSMPRSGGAVPLVVTTYEGRPTKLGPNKNNPDGAGTDGFVQASILDLYSPSRSQKVRHQGKESSLEECAAFLKELSAKGGRIGFLFGEDDSPTRSRLAKQLIEKFPEARFYAYEPLAASGDCQLVADYKKADRILSLGSDFIGLDAQQGPVRPFFDRRQGGAAEGAGYEHEINAEKMNRVYLLETEYSQTGGLADHRMRVSPTRLALVAKELGKAFGLTDFKVQGELTAQDKEALCGTVNQFDQWVKACAEDLREKGSRSLVLAGTQQPAAVKVIAEEINKRLGSECTKSYQTHKRKMGGIQALVEDINSEKLECVILATPANPCYDTPEELGFQKALKSITSVHLGLRLDATAMAATWHIPAAHYLESWGDTMTANGYYSVVQPMILPLYGGVSELDLLQALLKGEDSLLGVASESGAESMALSAVKETFGQFGKDEGAWKTLLAEGFLAEPSYVLGEDLKGNVTTFDASSTPSAKSLELQVIADYSVWDGRYIDNAWLQENPDPITKLTWDNAALISPQTAKDLNIYEELVKLESKRAAVPVNGEATGAHGKIIEIQYAGRTLKVPVLIAFGHADHTLTLSMGYGQKDTGLVGKESGFSATPLLSKSSFSGTGAQVKITEETYPLALTQEHHAMYGRALAREISTMTLAGKGDFKAQYENVKKHGMDSHAPENISLYKPMNSSWAKGDDKNAPLLNDALHQWGMTIDLNNCMGCNACQIACQAENNIPVVGKKQVAMGREMHWIRMDRYFAASAYERDDHGHAKKDEEGKKVSTPRWIEHNPEMIPQPVACVQCESAPCETVCPVNATVHTKEGLNAMAYNRCIGTRYCANNCPYKARRFNFFDYNKRNPLIKKNLYKGPFGVRQDGEATHLQRNPNVSVRMRGVMEKCTYCVQRLEAAKIKRKQVQRVQTQAQGVPSTEVTLEKDALRIAVDSVKVACQEACPSGSITFGNLLDKEKSAMVRAKNSPRNYDLLNYIGTRPRTSYLARVKNPNQAMPEAKYLGQATIHIH